VETLKEFRRQKGLSQKDLADISGVGQDTISGIESGRHEPRPSTLRKLAEALDVEVADFFRAPALSGKAEAPGKTGRPERKASVFDVAREAALAHVKEDHQLAARAYASEGVQDSFMPSLNEAMNRLREEYPVGDLAEGCVDLARHAAQLEQDIVKLEQENTRLSDVLEEHRRETARQ
jgi:transcriptional regulator with XRE-family HTH domain